MHEDGSPRPEDFPQNLLSRQVREVELEDGMFGLVLVVGVVDRKNPEAGLGRMGGKSSTTAK